MAFAPNISRDLPDTRSNFLLKFTQVFFSVVFFGGKTFQKIDIVQRQLELSVLRSALLSRPLSRPLCRLAFFENVQYQRIVKNEQRL